MKGYLYKLTCITNMHVGSDSSNYSIVDNEVEKDDLLVCPTIHGSGVKGAFRDMVTKALKDKLKESGNEPQKIDDEIKEYVEEIFGAPAEKNNKSEKPGAYAFIGANMLTRPLRVLGGNTTFINATTVSVINNFITIANSFNSMPDELKDLNPITHVDFKDNEFLCTLPNVKVEAEKTEYLDESNASGHGIYQLGLLKKLLGGDFALVKSFEDYPLPIVARNNLDEKNRNLWYEELVPHHTVFYLIILPPVNGQNEPNGICWLEDESIVQFGGNASIGCGYTKVERMILA